ncbi:MAG TPA: penicillin-binding protein activator LpoB [Candidatus Omnitrophota bacterium]|nr:penicillin-binding protein activator LpoB [Candidatus Omnitrophota bacterium]HPB68818.1 penicillin-binding protein activator LpoB [Candidatus Omnitrophota bacterium]HQO58491.1 penicillin-binding protein activator LpoB [Candidatus Omnitrophota bacterium]HQP12115.1 penicillin-binding protein activator LpoB [Candidatus Omnitrophota bacterium]
MSKIKILWVAVLALSVLSLPGCASKRVKRLNPDKVVDLSGRWNDTDSQLVAKEMIQDVLFRPWSQTFMGLHNRLPVVVVGPVTNRSHEHINADVFIKDLERNLLNSGKIKFVAAKGEERDAVRDERSSQQEGYTDPATIKAFGKETGADFIIIGSINSVKDEVSGRYVILYQVNLELIDIETNQKVWMGQKDIKKSVKRSKYSL